MDWETLYEAQQTDRGPRTVMVWDAEEAVWFESLADSNEEGPELE